MEVNGINYSGAIKTRQKVQLSDVRLESGSFIQLQFTTDFTGNQTEKQAQFKPSQTRWAHLNLPTFTPIQ